MRRLLEIDMRNAVVAHVMVIDQAERSPRDDAFDELGGGIDVGISLEKTHSLVGARGSFIAIFRRLLEAVRI